MIVSGRPIICRAPSKTSTISSDADDDVGRGQEAAAVDQRRRIRSSCRGRWRSRATPSAQNQILAGRGLARRLAISPKPSSSRKPTCIARTTWLGRTAIGGDVELEGGEGDGDQEGDPAGNALAQARRQAFDRFFGGARGLWRHRVESSSGGASMPSALSERVARRRPAVACRRSPRTDQGRRTCVSTAHLAPLRGSTLPASRGG